MKSEGEGGAHWPRLLMDTSAILRKVLLMQILQKQNETDRMQKISVAFCFKLEYTLCENYPEAFLRCFKLCEWGVVPELVNTIPDA